MRVLSAFTIAMVFLAFLVLPFNARTSQAQISVSSDKTYVCPMKCAGSENHEPGSCPVCGMALVLQKENSNDGKMTNGSEDGYVCPPCGHNCLETVFKEPGACGECGMALVSLKSLKEKTAAPQPQAADRTKVAILIFDGVQIIDYTGPYEIFGGAGFDVFTVAKTPDMITTVYGMRVTPQYALTNCPEPDIILVPGGGVFDTQNDPEIRTWLRTASEKAEHVLSVCNGAFILAKSGLLNGLSATTTRHLVDGLASAAPNIRVVKNVRWVDNGKIVTSGGLSAGMDAALHVVAKIRGQEAAERLARGIEYSWQQEALAEKHD